MRLFSIHAIFIGEAAKIYAIPQKKANYFIKYIELWRGLCYNI